MKKVLSIDLGASSGRAILTTLKDGKLEMKEIRRFSNDPVKVNNTLYWDILRIIFEIKEVLKQLKNDYDSLSIDSWGVDFVLLRKDGSLIENPIHYRDDNNINLSLKMAKEINLSALYEEVGSQFLDILTAFRIRELKRERKEVFKEVDKILMVPDYLNFILTGKKASEVSIASTMGLLDAREKDRWSVNALKLLNLSNSLFPKIIKSGDKVGYLKGEVIKELNIESKPVICSCSHDTQNAITALSSNSNYPLFISSGTWILCGVILDKPIINKESFKSQLTNEVGYNNCTTLLKNMVGLFLIQQLKLDFKRKKKSYSYQEIEKMYYKSNLENIILDPSENQFNQSGDFINKINKAIFKKYKISLEKDEDYIKVIYDSLATSIAKEIKNIQRVVGKDYDEISLVGGAVFDSTLSQLISNKTNLKVIAGSSEAASLGNAIIQLISLKAIKDIKEAREIISRSIEVKVYSPKGDFGG